MTLTFPWSNGLKMENLEAEWDATEFPKGEDGSDELGSKQQFKQDRIGLVFRWMLQRWQCSLDGDGKDHQTEGPDADSDFPFQLAGDVFDDLVQRAGDESGDDQPHALFNLGTDECHHTGGHQQWSPTEP